MSLIEDEAVPYEVYFDQFQVGKVYNFVFYNFLNPKKFLAGTRGKGERIEYYKWIVDSEIDYPDEGLVKNMPTTIHVSKQCFQRAHAKYKYLNFDYIKYLRTLKTEEVDMIIKFKRENTKTMKILNIEPLYKDDI